LLPKFKTEAIRNRDISQLTQSIKDLSDIGVVITEEDALVNEIIEQLGLSPLVERMKADLSLDDNDSDMEEKAKDVKEVKEKPKAVKDEIEEGDE
jgi:phage gp29-like protein